MNDDLNRARNLIADSGYLLTLTGSGISAESGIQTFRGTDGLWNGYRAEELATPEAFRHHPQRVWDFYHTRREKLSQARPNSAHYALAELEARLAGFALVTQNVDRLHQAAGSKEVVELHGNIWEIKCSSCKKVRDETGALLEGIPSCEVCGAMMRPAVVWFGEALAEESLDAAASHLNRCDLLLIIGTSGLVYPAAQFAFDAKKRGVPIIEINPDVTPFDDIADVRLRMAATAACAALLI